MIYFVQGDITKNIKIGWTENSFPLRFGQLSSSDTLTCLKTMSGDFDTEAKLHRRFDYLRSHGEWFKPGEDLLEFIDILASSEYDGWTQKDKPERVRITRAESLEMEQESFELGQAAFKAGKPVSAAQGIGEKNSGLWHRTKSMWEWGFEQAELASKTKTHIDPNLRG